MSVRQGLRLAEVPSCGSLRGRSEPQWVVVVVYGRGPVDPYGLDGVIVVIGETTGHGILGRPGQGSRADHCYRCTRRVL